MIHKSSKVTSEIQKYEEIAMKQRLSLIFVYKQRKVVYHFFDKKTCNKQDKLVQCIYKNNFTTKNNNIR